MCVCVCLVVIKHLPPERHHLKRDLRWDQSQQGPHRDGRVRVRRRGTSVEWAPLRCEVMLEQMITAETMRIKSETGRICSHNLITGMQPEICRQENKRSFSEPTSADRQPGGQPIVQIRQIILNLFFLVNRQMEEVMNGTFVWLEFLKRP